MMHPNLQPLSRHLYRWCSTLAGVHHPVNSYVLLRPEGAIVIDPAADLTPSVLEPLGTPRFLAILLTHVQEENAAGVYQFPDVPVYVPAGDEYLCKGTEAYQQRITVWPAPWEWEERGAFQGHLAGAINERPLPDAISIAGALAHGHTIHGLRVISTPGHGKNAVTLVADIDGKTIAFCGDIAHAGGTLYNWFDSEWDYGLQNGIKSLRKSLNALLELRPARLCPTHGPIIDQPQCSPGGLIPS
jgi:glyoxylase-like metal-dependent hydrolase (beta-lactamase superfamily II)